MLTGDSGLFVSRRALVAAAATATAATASGSRPAAAVPRVEVTPLWTEDLRRGYGVAVLPVTSVPAYGHVEDWMQRLADLGAGYLRGRYLPSAAETPRIVERCRTLGLKWLMTVIPEDWSMSVERLLSVLVHIRDNASDVCIGIENINEPNHNRDGSQVRPDWAPLTVGYQRIIREFLDQTPALAHAASVGPSLQMGAEDPTSDFLALRDAGIVEHLHCAGIHSYPAGWGPTKFTDLHLKWAHDAWGDLPTWVSETGYTTARQAPIGFKPVPQDVAAVYGPRSIVEFALRRCKVVRFQLLDYPNPGNDVALLNFGLVENLDHNVATWSPKKEFISLQAFLGSLRDPVVGYSPAVLRLGVDGPSNLEWVAVGKSDGSSRLLMYRRAPVWDPRTRTRRTVREAEVRITDQVGTRVVKVGAHLVSLNLR